MGAEQSQPDRRPRLRVVHRQVFVLMPPGRAAAMSNADQEDRAGDLCSAAVLGDRPRSGACPRRPGQAPGQRADADRARRRPAMPTARSRRGTAASPRRRPATASAPTTRIRSRATRPLFADHPGQLQAVRASSSTPGQKAMFAKYPTLPHGRVSDRGAAPRSRRAPTSTPKSNATACKLVADGEGIAELRRGLPVPDPAERPRGDLEPQAQVQGPVGASATRTRRRRPPAARSR